MILGQYFVTCDMDLRPAFHRPQQDVTHNARIKTFPDGRREVLVCTRPIFLEDGWERERKGLPESCQRSQRDGGAGQSVERAMRRARAQVRELALSNVFRYFVTLTLDKERIDRYDMAVITKRLNTWLDNNVRRRGLAYVLVPEHHKDGAIHFHGLFNGALEAVDSGHMDKGGHKVYNLPRWDFGFSTAIELYGEYDRAVAYVCKYIGKQTEKIGGRWYYSGGALKRPKVTLVDIDFRDALEMPGAYAFTVEDAGLGFVKFCLEKGGDVDGDEAHGGMVGSVRLPDEVPPEREGLVCRMRGTDRIVGGRGRTAGQPAYREG